MPPPQKLVSMTVSTRMQARWRFGVHLDAAGGGGAHVRPISSALACRSIIRSVMLMSSSGGDMVHLFTVQERWSQGRAVCQRFLGNSTREGV